MSGTQKDDANIQPDKPVEQVSAGPTEPPQPDEKKKRGTYTRSPSFESKGALQQQIADLTAKNASLLLEMEDSKKRALSAVRQEYEKRLDDSTRDAQQLRQMAETSTKERDEMKGVMASQQQQLLEQAKMMEQLRNDLILMQQAKTTKSVATESSYEVLGSRATTPAKDLPAAEDEDALKEDDYAPSRRMKEQFGLGRSPSEGTPLPNPPTDPNAEFKSPLAFKETDKSKLAANPYQVQKLEAKLDMPPGAPQDARET